MAKMKELWLNNLEKEEVEEQEGVSTEYIDDYFIKHNPEIHRHKGKNSTLTKTTSTL